MNKVNQKGFTLIELMIVVAIIGILAAIALPAYNGYIDKSRFSETINSTAAAKSAVEVCAQVNGGLSTCTGGTNGIPADIANKLVTAANGVITATSSSDSDNNSANDTYELKPTFANGIVTWESKCTPTTLC